MPEIQRLGDYRDDPRGVRATADLLPERFALRRVGQRGFQFIGAHRANQLDADDGSDRIGLEFLSLALSQRRSENLLSFRQLRVDLFLVIHFSLSVYAFLGAQATE